MKDYVLDLKKISENKRKEKLLTVKEVAKILGVSPLTVRNWDKKGKLKAIRHPINNYRLYRLEDIEKLLAEIKKIQL